MSVPMSVFQCQCTNGLLTFFKSKNVNKLLTYSQFCLPAILMSNALQVLRCQWSKCANASLTFFPPPLVTYLSYWLTSSFTFRLTYFDVKGPTSRALPILISNAISMLVCNECSNVSAPTACLPFLKSKNVTLLTFQCQFQCQCFSVPTACLPFFKSKNVTFLTFLCLFQCQCADGLLTFLK